MVPPTAPSSVLVRLLQAAGYRIEARPGATVAVRNRDRRAVVIARAGRLPTDLEPLFPPDSVHRTLVFDDDPGPSVRTDAAERGVEVVDPSTLGAALGELLLPGATGLGPEGEGGAEEPGVPFPIVPEGESVVRPRIGRVEAEALAGVEGSRYTLRLVPYYVAAYRVRSPSPHGESGPVLRRLVAVNATSRRAEVWDDGERELVPSIPEPHQQLSPQLTPVQARPLAIEVIRRHHAVRVDHTEQLGGALVIETRRISPSIDDVQLGPLALVYVPHWYAEGSEGRVILDAVTGHRIASGDPAPD